MAILTELKDPRIRDVTVIAVEVSPDMREAKVHVSIMGDETKQRLSLLGLRNAAGFLQSKVAEGIDTRYTPRLEFVLDQGVKKSIEISQILKRVLPPAGAGDAVGKSDSPVLSDGDISDGDTSDGDISNDETSRRDLTSGEAAESDTPGSDADGAR